MQPMQEEMSKSNATVQDQLLEANAVTMSVALITLLKLSAVTAGQVRYLCWRAHAKLWLHESLK